MAAAGALLIGGVALAAALHHGSPAAGPIQATPSPASPSLASSSAAPSPSASATRSVLVSPSAVISPPAQAATPSQVPTVKPSRKPTVRPSHKPTPTPSHTTDLGTLTASPGTVLLTTPVTGGPPSGTFTLTATGGPVADFTIDAPAGLTVAPATGSLAIGQAETIVVTATSSNPPLRSLLTINPGPVTVTVVYRPVN